MHGIKYFRCDLNDRLYGSDSLVQGVRQGFKSIWAIIFYVVDIKRRSSVNAADYTAFKIRFHFFSNCGDHADPFEIPSR